MAIKATTTISTFLFLLLLLFASPSGAVFTSDDDTTCNSEVNACFAETECSACVSEWGVAYVAEECETRYPGYQDGGKTCSDQGASYCCNLGSKFKAENCLLNSFFLSYWKCFTNGFHCSINDMPCYEGDPTPAPTPSPSSTPSALTTSPASSRGSPTSSPTDDGNRTTESTNSAIPAGLLVSGRLPPSAVALSVACGVLLFGILVAGGDMF